MTVASSLPVTTAITPGMRLRFAGVDADDFRMGMRRAQEHDMRHARQLHIADIKPASLHQPLEVRPRHGLADIGIRPIQHRKNVGICRCDRHGLRPMRARAVVSTASIMA